MNTPRSPGSSKSTIVVKNVADSMTERRPVASVVFAVLPVFRYARVAASSVPPRQYPIALTRDSPVAFSIASSAATGPSSM